MHEFRTFVDYIKLQYQFADFHSQYTDTNTIGVVHTTEVLIASCQVSDLLGLPEQMETDEGVPSVGR